MPTFVFKNSVANNGLSTSILNGIASGIIYQEKETKGIEGGV
jgi:hypothetical protein